MNILFISPCSPRDSVGGIERYVSNLIDYCKNKPDLNVTILLPSTEEDEVVDDEGVTLYFSESMVISRRMSAVQISKKARDFANIVEKTILKGKIDIVCAENLHLGLPPAYSILLNMVCVTHNIPLVLRLHSFATSDLHKELTNQLMWDRISCVSISVAGDCFTKGADVNILSTEYLGVNTSKFNDDVKSDKIRNQLGLTKDNKVVLTASRIVTGRVNVLAQKGIINLIESFSKISPRYPKLRLLIAVGRPSENLSPEFNNALEKLMGYIKIRNISEQTIVKVFDLDEMPDVYRASDLFVLASENETFGQVFIEAMASGVPVIGTKVGGIPEIISDSYNGYLVKPDDASVLAQRIEKLINNDSLRKDFIRAGKKTIQNKFTLDEQFGSFIEMLKTMIKRK